MSKSDNIIWGKMSKEEKLGATAVPIILLMPIPLVMSLFTSIWSWFMLGLIIFFIPLYLSMNMHFVRTTKNYYIISYGIIFIFLKKKKTTVTKYSPKYGDPYIKYEITEKHFYLVSLKKEDNATETDTNEKSADFTDYEELLHLIKKNAIIAGFTDQPAFNKIGGVPNLPADFEWPTYCNTEDESSIALTVKTRPMSFLMQINFADIKHLDTDNLLPNDGVLSVFYDNLSLPLGSDEHEQKGLKVFYFDKDTELKPFQYDYPQDEWESDGEFYINEQFLQFSNQTQIPFQDECELLMNKEYPSYCDIYEKKYLSQPEQTQILGCAKTIQGQCLDACKKFLPEDENLSNYVLLFQITSSYDTPTSFNLHDNGHLYAYIHKNDLLACNFDKIAYWVDFG